MAKIGSWKPARQKYGVAVVSYSGAPVLHSLSLQIGETVHIWEEYWADNHNVTWLRGCIFNNKNKKGIFPASYVQAKEYEVENQGPFEVVTPVEDAIIAELTFVLREWHGRMKILFVKQKPLFHTILLVMQELAKFRSTLVSNTLTKEQSEDLKHQAVTMIDWGNGQLGMDLVPRLHHRQVDPDKVSVVEMFRIHERSVQNCRAAWPDGIVKVKTREAVDEPICHLLVNVYSFACNTGDPAELLLSLYDNKEGKFISERFVMCFTRDGQRESGDKNSSTIFTDLSTEDFNKDLYLVLHILRKGSSKKGTNIQYRLPWGVSVLSLRDLFQIKSELEYFLRVQSVDREPFSTLHESLIKRQTNLVGRTSATDRHNQEIMLSLKILHGSIKTVKVENPILFNRGVVLTQRIGFSDFINPGEIRNDLYFTLHNAELEKGTKRAPKNVEVHLAVYNDKYELIKDCILAANGDNMRSGFHSYVLYHNNKPEWNETIRLSVPIEKFNMSHIRLDLYHCSDQKKVKKLYGFAYLSVTTKENTTRLDGKYDLCIYRCDSIAKVKNYLAIPSRRDEFIDYTLVQPNSKTFPHSSKEYITVETLLCSSKFAQKAELLSVLQWASNPNFAKTIPQHLEQLLTLKGQELVRYLQDILDALFNMLTSGEGQPVPFAASIFDALVRIFSLLHEEMFEKFAFVLEDYLEKSFSSPLAHRELMRCLQIQLEKFYTTASSEAASKRVFKVLDDVFKFSVKSCMLSQRIDSSRSVVEFRDNLNKVFDMFGKVLQSQESGLQKVQRHLLKNLHKVYIPLYFVIPNNELAKLVVNILQKVNAKPGWPVIKAKTVFIKNTINSQLLIDSSSRSLLLPLILGHIKKCLIVPHNLELTASTLGDLLSSVYKLKETCDIKEEVTKIVQGLFDVVVRTLEMLSGNKKRVCGNLLVACLTELLRLMDAQHYQKLMNDYAKPKPLKEFLDHVLSVFRFLLKTDYFPADWITMRMLINNVMLTAINYIADSLTVNFLHGTDFDRELWQHFFLLTVDFITQSALQLENYSEAKSSQVKSKYNDMRVPVGFLVYSLWNQLGSNKQHFMLELIGPFLKVTMVPQSELRKATIPIFFDIIHCEYQLNQHLRRVENRIVQEMDWLVLEHNGDVEYKQQFQSILLDKVQTEPELQEEGKRFVFSVTDLLERLLDYREIMDREEQRDTKMQCTFNILNFYKDSRRDMYIRYISRLYELHFSASNFVEAGLTLRLYAQLLTWSKVMHPEEMAYPLQTEAERKEELFSRIMDCFDKGKAWEYGIPLCKELAEYYEKTFQYRKLGQILQKQASFLYQILEGHKLRQDPSYYRVAYYGNTFPPYLKNKAFIYRGDECLKLATIMNQLTTEYPSATILTTNSPPDESLKHGDAQYIQIVSVKPVPAERAEFVGKEVPTEISCFYNTNEVDTFQFDRPYHRDGKDPNNEFKTLCLERTIIQTSYKLPGILRWYEAISTRVIQLTPVQTATDTVIQMNAELRSSTENARLNPDQFLRHLEMRLQGVISGAVNGGIPKYQEAFFNEEYVVRYPAEATHIEKLKSVILEQIQLLEHGLTIHGQFASAEMQPLHRNLIDTFVKMRKSMGYQNMSSFGKNRGSSASSGSGNQRPNTPSSVSQNSSGSSRSSVVSGGDVSYQEEDYMYVEKHECSQLGTEDSQMANAPPPPPPRQRSSPGFMDSPNISLGEQAPPIPTRKICRSSLSLSEEKQTSLPVLRSQSTKSVGSRETDSPPPPPRPSRVVAMSPTSGHVEEQAIPPIPEKRLSSSPLSNRTFSGSSLSICSNSSLGYNNFNHSSPNKATNNNETSSDNLNHLPVRKVSQHAAASSPQESAPPPIVARGSLRKDTPSSFVATSSSNEQSPLPSRSSINREPPTPPTTASSDSSVCKTSDNVTAPRTPSSKGPPPVPQRKPSVTPS
ncbi:hypothetical protein BsWGS_11892 [Bradybaena similaris]